MDSNDKNEFLRWLDNTKESYVKRRHMAGGFNDWQQLVAQQWLNERATRRQNFWVRLGICFTVISTVATLMSKYA